MAAPDRIGMDWIRRYGGTIFLGHIDMRDSAQSSYRVVDKRTGAPIGINLCDTAWRSIKRNGEKAGTSERVWFVDGHGPEIATLEEALEIRRILQLAEEPVG